MAESNLTREDPISRRILLDALPNELLDNILSFLDKPPPSITFEYHDPEKVVSPHTSSDLKVLSVISHKWRCLTLSRLFKYVRLHLNTLHSFLDLALLHTTKRHRENLVCDDLSRPLIEFLETNSLQHHVFNLLIDTGSLSGNEIDVQEQWETWKQEDPLEEFPYTARLCVRLLWRFSFPSLGTPSITMVAPPRSLAFLAGSKFRSRDDWAFDMPFHSIRFEREPASSVDAMPQTHEGLSKLINAQPWTSLSLNEGSFIKAYSTYEYFVKTPASILDNIPKRLEEHDIRSTLTSLTYTAIFPFSNHVNRVLRLAKACPRLEYLRMQLAPCVKNKILEDKDKVGKADIADMWMEMDSAYKLTARAIINMGKEASLKRYQSLDYAIKGLRDTLHTNMMSADKLWGWRFYGDGLWVRDETLDVAQVNHAT
ncbi:MAG: hypothetical protein M1812_005986 [Candelaria pacifica]|nr:MAG: hypothetical protein M1812_005986 [Candelaria pacifica]